MYTEQQRIYNKKSYDKNKINWKTTQKKWRILNKTKRNAQSVERSRNNKLKAIEYLGGTCKHCKLTFAPAVYDFHHTDPTNKDKEIGSIKGLSWEKIKLELDKCVLLCANCHRIEHNENE